MNFEAALAQALERRLKGAPANLAASIRYSLLAPGKRIRPRLAMACGQMCGLAEEAALPGALAIEMIHCFTLIHDDLPCMDDDDFRRGRPSNHKAHGEAIALLAGDALVPAAVETLAEAAAHVKPDHFLAALSRLLWASGPRGVIGGQAAEALLTERSALEDMRKMHEGKTGALFSAALLIPADLGGVDPASTRGQVLERFAEELGLAFQAADDLDDAQGDSDDEASKPTSILYFLPRDVAAAEASERLSTATRDLERTWGPESRELAKIAAEVLKVLE